MSRPTLYNEEVVQNICNQVMIGLSYADAANLTGIGESTLHEWQNKHPEFAERLKKAKLQCKLAMIGKIRTEAQTNWVAAAWWLERRYAKEYGKKRIIGLVHGEASGVQELADKIFGDESDEAMDKKIKSLDEDDEGQILLE